MLWSSLYSGGCCVSVIPRCSGSEKLCGPNSRCVDTPMSFRCECLPNHKMGASQLQCVGKDHTPKLSQCLFIMSYVVGIETVVKRHHSQ